MWQPNKFLNLILVCSKTKSYLQQNEIIKRRLLSTNGTQTFQKQSHQTVGNNKKSYRRKTIEATSTEPYQTHCTAYTPEEFTPNKLSTCRAIELKDKQSASFACPPGPRFPLGWSSIRAEQGAVRWEKVAVIVCMATIHSLTHSVSSSITLISSARARFCLHFCQSSFLFSLFPRHKREKNGNGNVASAIVRASTENCENTVTAGDIKQYGMFLISPTVAHLITQSVFFSTVYLSFFLCAPSLLFFLVYLFIISDNSNSNKCRWLTLAVNNFHYYYFVSCGLSSTSHRTCLLPTYWLWRHVFPITNSSFFSVVVLIHLWH